MITSTGFAAYDVALTANTVETVQLAVDANDLDVWVTAGGPVYFTVDGSTPTVKGQSTYCAPATGSLQVKVPGYVGNTLVKLIAGVGSTVTITGS